MSASDVRSCVVTGGARGIGRGIAERMVARGLQTVVTDIDGEAAASTAREIGAVAGLAHDVRDPAAHREVADVATEHGPLAAWFNNAGVGYDGTVADLDEERIRGLVEVNLLGAIWGTRAALDAFAGQGSRGGRGDIVNVASMSGFGPVPGLSVYAATKAAVVSLSTSLNVESPRGVRVHALCPDGVATAMVEAMADTGAAKQLVNSGGGLLTVDEIARAAEGLLGSRRVLRLVPAWRGVAMRVAGAVPSAAGPALSVFAAQGRRTIRKNSRT